MRSLCQDRRSGRRNRRAAQGARGRGRGCARRRAQVCRNPRELSRAHDASVRFHRRAGLAAPVLRNRHARGERHQVLLYRQRILLQAPLRLRAGRRRAGALRLLRQGRAGDAAARRFLSGRAALPRLANRHDPHALQAAIRRQRGLRRDQDGLHHPQPPVSGHFPHRLCGGSTASGPRGLSGRRRGVLRRVLVHEGGA